MLHWLGLSVLVVMLDLFTKWLALEQLEYLRPVAVLPFFNLTLVYNPGAAFSFLAGADGWQRWFFSGLSLVVSIVIVIWLARVPRYDRWLAAALALILGGALGNLYDRVTYGYVVDFLDFYYASYHFPAFNIADCAISVGACMLAIDVFRQPVSRR